MQNRYAFMQNGIIGVSKARRARAGGIRALEHQLTPGDVVLFLAYLDRVYDPIERLTGLYTTLQQNLGSVRRAQQLLAEAEATGANLPPLAAGRRTDSNSIAWVSPTTIAVAVLVDVSFRISRVSTSPSSVHRAPARRRSPDLLAGLYTPRAGTIRLDGQRLNDVSPASIRAAVRSVAADGTLFRASIRENIRYGRLDASDAGHRQAHRGGGIAAAALAPS